MLYRHALRRHRRTSPYVALAPAVTLIAMLSPLAAWAAEPAPPPAPELGRPGQVVFAELAGVRSGVPLQFGALPGGQFMVVISDVGWGGVLGYSRTQEERQTAFNGAVSTRKAAAESLWVAPSADVFLSRRVSVGLSSGFLWTRQKWIENAQPDVSGYEAYSIAAAPRVGYLVPMGGGVSFWPRLSVSFSYAAAAMGSLDEGLIMSHVSRSLGAGLDLGLVYHPTARLMFKLAPQIGVGRSISAGTSSTSPLESEGTWIRVGGEATMGVVL